MKLYILNGPNLNMLGVREPEHYGNVSYEALVDMIEEHCEALGIDCVCRQTNHEGELVDLIQEAYFEGAWGIVINPGAYTHTSIAILDAAKSVKLPLVEVHISKVEKREAYRQVSYIREAAELTVTGRYVNAVNAVTVRVPYGKIDSLRAVKGVRSVNVERVFSRPVTTSGEKKIRDAVFSILDCKLRMINYGRWFFGTDQNGISHGRAAYGLAP